MMANNIESLRKRPNDIEENTMYEKRLRDQEKLDQLLKEFSPANINIMNAKRMEMDKRELIWALFSFNNVANENGSNGGVYEILENDEIIYISGLPAEIHVRDALNSHFCGDDKLSIGSHLSKLDYSQWRNYQVRFMQSSTPREDARMLLRHHQLKNQGKVPRFN